MPPFVTALVEQYRAGPMDNTPQSIWRYTYENRDVYYVPPVCCDVPSMLYDGDGNVLCSPDGGITGRGDGRCADFSTQRSNGVAIWTDLRRTTQ